MYMTFDLNLETNAFPPTTAHAAILCTNCTQLVLLRSEKNNNKRSESNKRQNFVLSLNNKYTYTVAEQQWRDKTYVEL